MQGMHFNFCSKCLGVRSDKCHCTKTVNKLQGSVFIHIICRSTLMITSLCTRQQIVQDVRNLSTGARTIHSHECSPAVWHSHKGRGGVSNPPLCPADVMLLWHHSHKLGSANSRERGHRWVTNGLCLTARHSAPCATMSIAWHHLAAILQIKFGQASFGCGGNKDKHR